MLNLKQFNHQDTDTINFAYDDRHIEYVENQEYDENEEYDGKEEIKENEEYDENEENERNYIKFDRVDKVAPIYKQLNKIKKEENINSSTTNPMSLCFLIGSNLSCDLNKNKLEKYKNLYQINR